MNAGSERRTVTVVFCDLAGSTSMGEQLDSESLRRVMARYYEEMRGALAQHGGTVEKFIGDAAMAIFDTGGEGDALRAVRAAAEMREALAVLNEELEQVWGIRIRARTGVSTGEVAGDTGAGGETLAIGDAVNMAIHLEGAAGVGEILLSESTHRLVGQRVRVEALEAPPFEAKPQNGRLPAFRLLEVSGGLSGTHRRVDAKRGAEQRKTVTIVFCDLAQSDDMNERLGADRLSHVISRYYEQMRSELERHGGTVEKFVGDAVMAVFGIPTLHEDDALRAVRAAMGMRQSLEPLSDECDSKWGLRLTAKIGVNTGEVVAGDPSDGEAFVVGDAVNVAARLEQAAPAAEILIGGETHRLVRDAVEVEPVEPLALKGKADPVPAFRLLTVADAAAAPARRLDSPLVGRERELALLMDMFERSAEAEKSQLVTVMGLAGVGKSRLTHELIEGLGARARVVRGRCLPYGEGITFWPIVEVVREAAGIEDEDSSEQATAKIADLVGNGEDGLATVEAVAGAVGLSDTTPSQEETFWAIRRLLAALAAEQPLLVVFDDIHWAEPTFLDLVEYLGGVREQAPMLLLCMARPELRDLRPALTGDGVPSVLLEPLDASQSKSLIENLLGQAELAGEVADRIAQSAGGNPLFVEEMLRMLVDDGMLERVDSHWRATGDVSEIGVPPTIEALLGSRIDRLAPGERTLIERASVIGQEFWLGAVAELSKDPSREEVEQHLQALIRKELVEPGGLGFAGEDAYRFTHILIRDVAYGGSLKETRSKLHEGFAHWLERKAGARATEYEEILGYHFEQAFRYREQLAPVDAAARALASLAADRLGAAGGRANARGDMPAAVKLLERTLSLLGPQTPRRLAPMLDLGLALFEIGQLARAEQVLDEMAEEARTFDDRRLELRALVELASFHVWTKPEVGLVEMPRVAELAIPLFERRGDELGLARAWRNLADVHAFAARWAEMEDASERALAYAMRTGDQQTQTAAIAGLAGALIYGPTPAEEGVRRLEQRLEEVGGGRMLRAVADAWAIASLKAMGGEVDEGRRLCRAAASVFEEFGQEGRLADLALYLARIEMLGGDAVTAEAELRRSYDALSEMGEKSMLSTVAGELAEAVYEQGRPDEAAAWVADTKRLAADDDVDSQVRWRTTRARLLADDGDHSEAVEVARQAVDLARGTDFLNLQGVALMALGDTLAKAGRRPEAASALEEARAVYLAKGNMPQLQRATETLAALDQGDAGASH